ncbi:hypothetical protein [uncultured Mucilaginibacter sp.]|uniref:hypothetical protein n=1 Tax=uncultured Mucilaginibacter sp. TaxID=797541 RepID=UPI0025E0CEC0|nr:hypothetical protein [uncultured Mucilaginibacter sp.]
MKFQYHTEGYLKDPSFTADLLSFLKNYAEKFPGIEELRLNVDAIWAERVDFYIRKNQFEYSKNGTVLTINTYEMFNNVKGKIVGMTSPFEFYQNLRFLFGRAVDEH